MSSALGGFGQHIRYSYGEGLWGASVINRFDWGSWMWPVEFVYIVMKRQVG